MLFARIAANTCIYLSALLDSGGDNGRGKKKRRELKIKCRNTSQLLEKMGFFFLFLFFLLLAAGIEIDIVSGEQTNVTH